jgi:hypothetical protein
MPQQKFYSLGKPQVKVVMMSNFHLNHIQYYFALDSPVVTRLPFLFL